MPYQGKRFLSNARRCFSRRQVGPLKEQSKKAKEYLENKNKLDNLEVALLAHDIEFFNELIKEAKQSGKLIVFIKDTHTKESTEFERFGNTNHCLENTFESELINELKTFENDKDTISIQKNSTSFMEAPEFRKLMEHEKEMNEFDVIGCCTDICVANGTIALANYLDENNRSHTIRVHEDAIATYAENERREYVDAAKLLMKQQGIQLVKKINK